MGKARFSPSTILTKAMEIYLRDENITIEEMIKSKEKVTLRLRTVAFSLRTILSYYGYNIETVINESTITVKSVGIQCYEIQDKQFELVESVSSLCFVLVVHWGNISTLLDKMGQIPQKYIKENETVQTALVI